jgi:beta-mannosidase
MATCGVGGTCFVKNDAIVPFSGTVEILSVNFETSATTSLFNKKMALSAGAGVKEMFNVTAINGSTDILLSTVTAPDGTVLSQHPIPFTAPKNMLLPKATVTATVATTPNPDGSVDVTVSGDKLALYVTLTTSAQGYFSENAYLLIGGKPKIVTFIPVQGFEMSQLKSLRVEHTATYM